MEVADLGNSCYPVAGGGKQVRGSEEERSLVKLRSWKERTWGLGPRPLRRAHWLESQAGF